MVTKSLFKEQAVKLFLFLITTLGSLSLFSFDTNNKNEISFDEKIVFNQEQALKELIPGTQDYYYYNCLISQHKKDFEKANQLLKEWRERYGKTVKYRMMLNRQMLFLYDQFPNETLKHLVEELRLEFNHQKLTAEQEANYPNTLDQELISWEKYKNLPVQKLNDDALRFIDTSKLSVSQLRSLLSRVKKPDFPNLVKLIIKDLSTKNKKTFGYAKIHKNLTLEQLKECLKLQPNLKSNQVFVNEYLRRLTPAEHTNWQQQPLTKEKYLNNLWGFVQGLGSAFNSLKAHVLLNKLQHEISLKKYKETNFIEYLKLPKPVHYINTRLTRHERYLANLSTDYFRITSLKANTQMDTEVVMTLLEYCLKDADSPKKFLPYIKENFLNQVFAKTKILYGKGDPQKWFSLISKNTAIIKDLRESVEINLLPENKQFIRSDEDISLSLQLKNVPNLLVKIYKLNQFNYYKSKKKAISTDIDLDGIVATQELSYNYSKAPHLRHTEVFNINLDEPGTYVLDFIGNGKSSRALIHKGYLSFVQEPSAAGHVFRIFNDKNDPIKNASIYLDGHTYEAHEKGFIMVPYTGKSATQKIIIKHADFASLESFYHMEEKYSFTNNFWINRESLIPNNQAKVLIDTKLTLNKSSVPLKLLKDISLTLTSTNSKGLTSSLTSNDFKLFNNKKAAFEFNVPPNLRELGFTLKAKITRMSDGETVDLKSQFSFDLNQLNNGPTIKNAFLKQSDKGYFIEVLGRNGEVQKNAVVNLSLNHKFLKKAIRHTLKTNENGSIFLGKLKDIYEIHSGSFSNISHWSIEDQSVLWPATVNVTDNEIIKLPLAQGPQSKIDNYSLIEYKKSTPFAIHTAKIKITENYLEVSGLPEGQFRLYNKDQGSYAQIHVNKGKVVGRHIVGKFLTTVKNYKVLPSFKSINTVDNKLKILLENYSPSTRVHIVQSRFHLDNTYDFTSPSLESYNAPYFTHGFYPSYFLSGRNIGDEYRYILARRNSPKFPGNMLDRPGLLLNPWELNETQTDEIDALGDTAFGKRSAKGRNGAVSSLGGSRSGQNSMQAKPSFDFLAPGRKVFENLIPNAKGEIEISKFGKGENVHIFLFDENYRSYQKVFLPEDRQPFKDIRLTTIFNPEMHFVETEKVSIIKQNTPFSVKSINAANIQTYKTLKDVYSLFKTLSKDSNLDEFSFILDWLELDENKKQELYSKYACHELNFFIYKKDSEFFNKVILPYYKNKKQDTFLDQWLKKSPKLSSYTQTWNYHRLNIVEKILLAKNLKHDGIAKEVDDILKISVKDRAELSKVFSTALQSKALITSVSEKKKMILKEGRESKVPFSSLITLERPQETSVSISEEIVVSPSAFGYSDNSQQLYADVQLADDSFADDVDLVGGIEDLRQNVQQFYRKIGQVKEWAENNYYQLPIAKQTADLVTVNAFWRDYAAHKEGPFLSENFTSATKNFTEMMFVLSVLDLPFKAEEIKTEFKDDQMELTSTSDLILFHREIEKQENEGNSNILIKQQFFDSLDRYKGNSNAKVEKYVTKEFLTGRVYGAKIIISNANASTMKLEILQQIPQGSIPVNNSQNTMTNFLTLNPYETKTLEYFFYFPTTGTFKHFPVHASAEGILSSYDTPFTFNVVEKASEIDETSWLHISQNASDDQVLSYLKGANLHLIKLPLTFWRLKDSKFCQKFLEVLKMKNFYNNQAYSYALKHDLAVYSKEFLKYSNIANTVGPFIESPLLSVNPVERFKYEFKEYSPLVNARTYQLGKKRSIANRSLLSQYNKYMHYMSYKSIHSDSDKLTQSYLLLLQDRISEGIELFNKVNRDQISEKMQYDYMQAYIYFYLEEPEKAANIALQYTNSPVIKWQSKFKNILSQIQEIKGNEPNAIQTENRNETQNSLAAKEAIIEFEINKNTINAFVKNLDEVTVNYYPMDIELLFSRKPFIESGQSDFSIIKAKYTEQKKVTGSELNFDIPDSIKDLNVMVEISGKGLSASKAYFSHNMKTAISQNYGILQVINPSQKPLSKVYVKVYSKDVNGNIRFHKDGYTDLRGKFDYVSVNSDSSAPIESFSILLLSDDHGAMIKEAKPPKI